jgi:hypothetical protein
MCLTGVAATTAAAADAAAAVDTKQELTDERDGGGLATVLSCFPEPAAGAPSATGKRRAGGGAAAAPVAPGPGPGLRRAFKLFEGFLRQAPAFDLAAAAMGVLAAAAARAKCAVLGRELSAHALWCLQQVCGACACVCARRVRRGRRETLRDAHTVRHVRPFLGSWSLPCDHPSCLKGLFQIRSSFLIVILSHQIIL